ncbi:MAG: tRNA (N6-threonylcarbamoyladenosine(37)-N6)-methyltransferase TrmO [Lachnospiraceae bacterium]|nr:tRNA (N6-threonylcarbamoyladenosine(37)-N6)-methyltransferase TrmO [Lachnospiraceae bacterium]
MNYQFRPIAYIHSDFPDKFGIPRQSGLAQSLKSTLIFEPDFRFPDAFRGLEDYSHIWLIWGFSENKHSRWTPTVRPPRLGGNTRKGVFATRSPFRPNPVGLSSVKLDKIEFTKEHGPVLHISGADLMNGTPIFDIKPYLPYVDSHPDALNGFANSIKDYALHVTDPHEMLSYVPIEKRSAIIEILSQDPRPSYQEDPKRIYGLRFSDYEIKFRVEKNILYILSIQ